MFPAVRPVHRATVQEQVLKRMYAFVTQDKDDLVTGVKNWNLYHACAKELKVWPDTNLLWDFPFNDLFQQCRDDILHQIDLGMMQHLQNALVSRYIMELHKPFSWKKELLQDQLV